jgi:hypothetical protein
MLKLVYHESWWAGRGRKRGHGFEQLRRRHRWYQRQRYEYRRLCGWRRRHDSQHGWLDRE